MGTWLQNAGGAINSGVGKTVAELGGMASLLAGQDLRIGGGQGLGARIAGQANPYFTVAAADQGYQGNVAPPTNGQSVINSSIPGQGGNAALPTGNPVNSPGGGGAGQVLGAQAPSNQTYSAPGQANVDYNAIYQPALDALQGAIASANQNYAGQEASINSQAGQAQGSLDTALSGQMNQIGQAKTTQQTGTKNAMQQAQQGYNEISQGIQSRYGGTTGTGAFANEIAGRQTSTNMAQFQTNLTNALGGLDQAAQQVQTVHDQNIKDLKAQTDAAIQQAKSTLQTNIANIGMQQGQVQSAKASQIANAVIDYQKSVDAVNQMNVQYAQQLQMQQNQIQANLAYARQVGTSYLTPATTNATQMGINNQNTQNAQVSPVQANNVVPTTSQPAQYNWPMNYAPTGAPITNLGYQQK
jgi:hypothetical protein